MSMSPAISMVCTGCARFIRRSRFDTALRERPTALRRLLVGETEIGDQALDALRFFERIEVFALDVLDQRHRGGGLVVDIAHQHRDLVQAGQLRRAEAAFAGDDLVAVTPSRPIGRTSTGCIMPWRLDRCRQFGQRAFVHAGARLVFAGLQLGDRQRGRRAGVGRGLSSPSPPSSASRPRPRPLSFLVAMMCLLADVCIDGRITWS